MTPLEKIATTRLKELEEDYESKLEGKINSKQDLTIRKARLEFLIESMNTQRTILGMELINVPKSEKLSPEDD